MTIIPRIPPPSAGVTHKVTADGEIVAAPTIAPSGNLDRTPLTPRKPRPAVRRPAPHKPVSMNPIDAVPGMRIRIMDFSGLDVTGIVLESPAEFGCVRVRWGAGWFDVNVDDIRLLAAA